MKWIMRLATVPIFILFLTTTANINLVLNNAWGANSGGNPPGAPRALSCSSTVSSTSPTPTSTAFTDEDLEWRHRIKNRFFGQTAQIRLESVTKNPQRNKSVLEQRRNRLRNVMREKSLLDQSVSQWYLRQFSQSFSGTISESRREEDNQTLMDMQLHRKNLIDSQKSQVVELLESLGIPFLTLIRDQYFPLFLILPATQARHAFSKAATDLYIYHDTLLVVADHSPSHFSIQENVMYLSYDSLFRKQLTRHMQRTRTAIDSHFISEIEITPQLRQSEVQFLMNPENAIPGSLRFLSYSMGPQNPLELAYRFSFRTGIVPDLSQDIRDGLIKFMIDQPLSGESGLRPNLKRRIITAAALRSPQGDWLQSSTVHFGTPTETTVFSFSPAFTQIQKLIGQRGEKNEKGLPDLFFLIAGKDRFMAPEIALIEKMASDATVGLNSVSLVLLNWTQQYGLIYYIHTVQFGSQRDLTVYADQLKNYFDFSAAVDRLIHQNIEFNPFNVK